MEFNESHFALKPKLRKHRRDTSLIGNLTRRGVTGRGNVAEADGTSVARAGLIGCVFTRSDFVMNGMP